MAQDEFTKLFTYMSERFDKIDTRLENVATKEDIQKILSTLDSLTKKVEIN